MTTDDADGSAANERGAERRLAAVEAEVAALRGEIAQLRGLLRSTRADAPRSGALAAPAPARDEREGLALPQPADPASPPTPTRPPAAIPGTDRTTRRSSFTPSGAAASGAEIESFVGRFGTLALGALALLLGVGTLIVWAVNRGLLTPEVRVSLGALAAVGVAGVGLYFRRVGERRYGNVLLALALAIADLVAWGAGPRLHVIPTSTALLLVDLAALGIAALAVHDESEFLFAVAIAGALSAPFVTTVPAGDAAVLLSYGGVVLLGAIRAARAPEWHRALVVLLAGAGLYALSAAAAPVSAEWYGPFLIQLFGGALALAALLLAQPEWRSTLSRGFLGVALLGVAIGWDFVGDRSPWLTALVAIAIGVVAHAALWVREHARRLWITSALLLPLVPLGIAVSGTGRPELVSLLWSVAGLVSLAAWQAERRRGEAFRGGVHLLAGSVLVGLGIANALRADSLALVAGLTSWGVALAVLNGRERFTLPLVGLALVLGSAAACALVQLAGLQPYSYVPFATRFTASAFVAGLGIAAAGELLARGSGAAAEIARRPLRFGVLIAFVFIWGRLELVHAFSLELGTFLLTLYYAAVGVGAIVAGRRFGSTSLRVAGLALAVYAALKAVSEAWAIEQLLLRVGFYALVGVFLLGAGYLYRNAGGAGDGELGGTSGAASGDRGGSTG